MARFFTDKQIFDGIQSRESATVDDIVRFLYAQCQRSITHLVTLNQGNLADAEDLFQDVILAFLRNTWEGRFLLRSDVKVTTYIYQIAHTMWLKELRRQGAHDRRIDQYGQKQSSQEDDMPSPEDELIEVEKIQSGQAIFNQLGNLCQQILKAFYIDGKSMLEISQEFNLGTEDNAKTRKYRCIQSLRKLMTP
ncbi:hypothetical protein GCM10028807_53740 [Spirosoma daeguense]